MKVKYYKTKSENDRDDNRRCRFEMLSKLIDADVVKFPGLKPRLLHIQDRDFHGSVWTTAIIAWEPDIDGATLGLRIIQNLEWLYTQKSKANPDATVYMQGIADSVLLAKDTVTRSLRPVDTESSGKGE